MNKRLMVCLTLMVSLVAGVIMASQQTRPDVLSQPIVKDVWSTDAYHLAFGELSDGGMIQYGSSDIAMYGDAMGNSDGILIKRAPNGNPVWGIRFASAGNDDISGARSLPDGSVVCLVSTNGNILGNTAGTESDYLVKISSLGTQLWATKIPLGAIYIEGVDDQGFLLMNHGDVSTQATYVNTSGSVLWSYTWTAAAVEYLGRHGTHSRFYVTYDNTCNICCIQNGQLCSDTVTPVYSDVDQSMVTLNNTDYMIRTEEVSGNVYLSLVSLSTGQSTHLVNLPNNSSYHIRTISNGGDRSWLLVERQDFSWITGPDMIESPANTRSAAVYEVTSTSAAKQFDIYQSFDFFISSSFRRSDGSFMFVVCFKDGGDSDHEQMGTNIKTFTSNGVLINDITLNEYTDSAAFNTAGNMLYGRIYYGTPASPYDTKWAMKSYYASLSTVAAPTFNLAPGNYTGTQSVSISCATTGAVIRYTTDGSEPTPKSKQYSTPLTISTNTTVKARGFKAATLPSLCSDAAYKLRRAAASNKNR